MPIDVHAHYVPRAILDVLHRGALDCGVSLTKTPACAECVHFEFGLTARPFFPRLIEKQDERLKHMDKQGISRQVLCLWADIFGYALPSPKGTKWHRLLNESLGSWCSANQERFAWLASGALPDAASAARELERAVREGGAAGGVVAANVSGVNLGELDLDEYWAAATSLDVPVFVHPTQPEPTSRTGRFALNPIAQYTFDTTLAIGSLISSGVLDRYPRLNLILSHGGGAFPYLAGRFDCLTSRMPATMTGHVAKKPPSAYLKSLYYDIVLHSSGSLRFLAESVSIERMVLGTDDGFPPAEHDPLGSLRAAGFGKAEIETISETNPRRIFRL